MNLPKLLLVVLVLTVVCSAAAAVAALVEGRPTLHPTLRTSSPVRPEPARPGTTAAAALARWDRQRAEVWAHGSPGDLARLYTPTSSAGRSDRAMLRDWRRRGARVTGLRTQLLSVTVIERRPTTWVLRVTDRLAAGVAVQGRDTITLPRDRPSSYVLVMRRVGQRWRVASVRDA